MLTAINTYSYESFWFYHKHIVEGVEIETIEYFL